MAVDENISLLEERRSTTLITVRTAPKPNAAVFHPLVSFIRSKQLRLKLAQAKDKCAERSSTKRTEKIVKRWNAEKFQMSTLCYVICYVYVIAAICICRMLLI